MELKVTFQNLSDLEFTLGKKNDGFTRHKAIEGALKQTPSSPLQAKFGTQMITATDDMPVFSAMGSGGLFASCIWTNYAENIRFGFLVNFDGEVFGMGERPTWQWLLDQKPDTDGTWVTPPTYTEKVIQTITTATQKTYEIKITPNQGRYELTSTVIFKKVVAR